MRPMTSSINMLSDQQLAKLFVHLEVPMAMQTLLESPAPFDPDDRDALQDLICAQTPDQAMLSIALCALLLDARLRLVDIRSAEILAMSAEMMVQDYAPLYLEHIGRHPKGTLFDRHDLEFLSTIPEDLESLADLLTVLGDVLPAEQIGFIDLARVLAAQARAQGLIADTLVEAFTGIDLDMDTEDEPATPQLATPTPTSGDNIIPFRRK
jgi:hypothetical protein